MAVVSLGNGYLAQSLYHVNKCSNKADIFSTTAVCQQTTEPIQNICFYNAEDILSTNPKWQYGDVFSCDLVKAVCLCFVHTVVSLNRTL